MTTPRTRRQRLVDIVVGVVLLVGLLALWRWFLILLDQAAAARGL